MRLRAFACLLVLSVLPASAGCGKLLGPKEAPPIKAYPDGQAGLETFFRDVLAAAKADDREQVHSLFKSLKMTRPALDRLFGARAAELAKPYEDMMATLMHRGAVELVAVIYEKKYDTVEVVAAVEPDAIVGEPPTVRPDEVALARALVWRPMMYSVRLKKNGEALGTRYDFMFYDEGGWRTGNQLGKVIAKRDSELQQLTTPSTTR